MAILRGFLGSKGRFVGVLGPAASKGNAYHLMEAVSGKKISLIIPCRNEQGYIATCLNSILNGDYPKELIEIILVDGESKDATKDIIASYQKEHDNIICLNNPKKTAPSALNIGIKAAACEIIIRLDAHTAYSSNYLSKCVDYLTRYGASNVGGVIKTLPGNNTLLAKSFALVLSHPFGVGPSFFRIGVTAVKVVDTVPFGCFRKEIFNEVGLFDENKPRNEDLDFNFRLRKAGKKIILVPEIISHYYARGNLKSFILHNFDNGYKVTDYLGTYGCIHSWRHFVPFFSVTCFLVLISLSFFSPLFAWMLLFLTVIYLLLCAAYSIKIAVREKRSGLFVLLPVTFGILHASYGVGSLAGFSTAIKRTWFAPPTLSVSGKEL